MRLISSLIVVLLQEHGVNRAERYFPGSRPIGSQYDTAAWPVFIDVCCYTSWTDSSTYFVHLTVLRYNIEVSHHSHVSNSNTQTKFSLWSSGLWLVITNVSKEHATSVIRTEQKASHNPKDHNLNFHRRQNLRTFRANSFWCISNPLQKT
jgi:hypothetical protein